MNLSFLLNDLPKIDVIFFASCLAIVAAIVGIYFLIPVINRKQYMEQRENLKKREASFRANLKTAPKEEPEESSTKNG